MTIVTALVYSRRYKLEGYGLQPLLTHALHLTLRGPNLEGTMQLTDGTLWRDISLVRNQHHGPLLTAVMDLKPSY